MKKLTAETMMEFIRNSNESLCWDGWYEVYFDVLKEELVYHGGDNTVSAVVNCHTCVDFDDYESIEEFENDPESDFDVVCDLLTEKMNKNLASICLICDMDGNVKDWFDDRYEPLYIEDDEFCTMLIDE